MNQITGKLRGNLELHERRWEKWFHYEKQIWNKSVKDSEKEGILIAYLQVL